MQDVNTCAWVKKKADNVNKLFGWTGHFIKNVARRSVLGMLIAIAIAVAPIPAEQWPLAAGLQMPATIIVAVVTLGKSLYDTLFYDRYWP